MPKDEKQAHDPCSDLMELNDNDLSSATGGALQDDTHAEHAQKHGGVAKEGERSTRVDHYGFLWRKKAEVTSQNMTYKDGTSKTIVTTNKIH